MFKNKHFTNYIFFFILIFTACNSINKTYVQENTYIKIKQIFKVNTKNDLLTYYFDGDCSFCISKVKYLESQFIKKNDITLVFISKKTDVDILKYNMQASKISSQIFIDRSNFFYKKMPFNQTIIISQKDKSYVLLKDK